MAGNIRKRGARYTAQVKLPGGATRARTFDTRAQAQAWANSMTTRKAAGERLDSASQATTVGDLWPTYLAMREGKRAANTLDNNRTHWRVHVAPVWGDTPISKIRPSAIETWLATSENAGMGVPTLEKSFRLLRGLLAIAVRDGLIATNPCEGITVGAYEAKPKTILTPLEMRAVLDAITDENDRLLIELMSVTGLRIGEALGLRGVDLDPERNLLHIRQTWTRRGIKEGTKANRGRQIVTRQVPVTAALMARLTHPRPVGSTRLFVGDDRNLNRRVLAKACRAAGVPVVTLHSLRHYAITRLLDQGLTSWQVAGIMGHADTRMVERVYSHRTTDSLEAARRAMEGLT